MSNNNDAGFTMYDIQVTSLIPHEFGINLYVMYYTDKHIVYLIVINIYICGICYTQGWTKSHGMTMVIFGSYHIMHEYILKVLVYTQIFHKMAVILLITFLTRMITYPY